MKRPKNPRTMLPSLLNMGSSFRPRKCSRGRGRSYERERGRFWGDGGGRRGRLQPARRVTRLTGRLKPAPTLGRSENEAVFVAFVLLLLFLVLPVRVGL